MQFSHTIPDPSTIIAGKERYQTIAAGTELHRLHHGDFGATAFNATDRGNARFSPIRDRLGSIIPTIYAGATFECAACEIVLRCPDTPPVAVGGPVRDIVHPDDFKEYRHSRLMTTSELSLLDLTVSGQRRIGISDNVLLAGPRSTYGATRAWAEQIHETFPRAQGLYYLSYQAAPQFAIVLFGDRMSGRLLDAVESRDVADRACHEEIERLAEELSIDYANL